MKIRLDTGREIPVREGQSVLDALKEAEIYLVASCGGKGTCGKCRIKVLGGSPETKGLGKLTGEERAAGIALACRSFAKDDSITIEIPETSRLVVGEKIAAGRAEGLMALLSGMGAAVDPMVKEAQIRLPAPTLDDPLSDLERLKRALGGQGLEGLGFSHHFMMDMGRRLREADWNVLFRHAGGSAVSIRPAERKFHYGAAVDIGTTTVVVYLVNLADGRLVDVGLTYNSQMRHGDDVITRIVHATEGGGLGELRGAVRDDINGLLETLAGRHGIPVEEIDMAVLSGNTTMSHLFWGIDPGSIREEPYVPAVSVFPMMRGSESRLRMNPDGAVHTVPCVASYVGGDIVAGVLASGMHRRQEIALFMDIGTNGEIAVGNNEWLITAACSAGPCFEGSGIRHGMRATEGAIESVRISPADFEPEVGVIGKNGPHPRGICGSGMIDAISEMFLRGVIDMKGNFRPEAGSARIRLGEDGMEFLLASSPLGEITLTGVDIENVLRAKAAIYAGVSTLLKDVGLAPDAIERVYIAGGFGNYLNVEKAIILGMLPDMPREKFSFLGNTSITGAYLCLVSEAMKREADEIAAKMTYAELSVSSGFMNEYMSALFLPHTDIAQFPTVEELLRSK
jgi:uncharacterized 2Fe-2S/4Fe-4S cluster protein (DUF4445 family)